MLQVKAQHEQVVHHAQLGTLYLPRQQLMERVVAAPSAGDERRPTLRAQPGVVYAARKRPVVSVLVVSPVCPGQASSAVAAARRRAGSASAALSSVARVSSAS